MIEISIQKKLRFQAGMLPLRLNLKLEPGSFTVISGKSGSGKSSLLRMLAGLLLPDEGKITVNGNTWFDSSNKLNLKPQQREIGFVFQDYALFPNMTLRQNLEYALKSKEDIRIVEELIELIELGDLQNQKAQFLSGGQQQRIALARALVQKPSILLLDEPLAALDVEMRHKLQAHLLKLHHEYKLTMLMVSHDKSEIIKLADRLLVLEDGAIIKDGKPKPFLNSMQFKKELKLTAKVIGINDCCENVVLNLLLGNEKIDVETSSERAKLLRIGDFVELVSNDYNLQFNK